MTFNRDKAVAAVGGRLNRLRSRFNFNLGEMARRLGLSRSGYYKEESGLALPKLEALNVLQQEYDISMDWLLFDKGPVYFREKVAIEEEPKGLNLEKLSPYVGELLEYMEKDPLLQHEVLVQFFKYKEKKEHPNKPVS